MNQTPVKIVLLTILILAKREDSNNPYRVNLYFAGMSAEIKNGYVLWYKSKKDFQF